jgi:hypothetical protein
VPRGTTGNQIPRTQKVQKARKEPKALAISFLRFLSLLVPKLKQNPERRRRCGQFKEAAIKSKSRCQRGNLAIICLVECH